MYIGPTEDSWKQLFYIRLEHILATFYYSSEFTRHRKSSTYDNVK